MGIDRRIASDDWTLRSTDRCWRAIVVIVVIVVIEVQLDTKVSDAKGVDSIRRKTEELVEVLDWRVLDLTVEMKLDEIRLDEGQVVAEVPPFMGVVLLMSRSQDVVLESAEVAVYLASKIVG
jgi:hypothetical protein